MAAGGGGSGEWDFLGKDREIELLMNSACQQLDPFVLATAWKLHADAMACHGTLVRGLPDVCQDNSFSEEGEPQPAVVRGKKGGGGGGREGDGVGDVLEGGEAMAAVTLFPHPPPPYMQTTITLLCSPPPPPPPLSRHPCLLPSSLLLPELFGG